MNILKSIPKEYQGAVKLTTLGLLVPAISSACNTLTRLGQGISEDYHAVKVFTTNNYDLIGGVAGILVLMVGPIILDQLLRRK